LGYCGKEAGQPVYNLLGGQVHEKLRTYTYIYARPGDATDVYGIPTSPRSALRSTPGQGFHGVSSSIRPVPTAAFDGRQLSLEEIDRSVRFCRHCAKPWHEADLLFGTHGQDDPGRAIRLAKKLEPTMRCGSKSPCPRMHRRMAKVGARDVDSHCHRRAARHQVRLRAPAASRRGCHPAQ